MNMNRIMALTAAAAASLTALPTQAATTISLYANLGPGRVQFGAPFDFVSPSYDAYAANAIIGIQAGMSTGDIETDPTAFEIKSERTFASRDVLMTEFTSWRGDVDPTGAFANENGTAPRLGVHVLSDTLFQGFDLFTSFENNQGASSNGFQSYFGPGFDSFDQRTVGVRWVGARGGGDDIYFTSGSIEGVELNELILVDSSLGFIATNDAVAALGSEQAVYDDFDAFLAAFPYSVTVGYELRGQGDTLASATDTLNFVSNAQAAVPEPATWAMMIGGFGMMGWQLRRRRVTFGTARAAA